MLKRLEHSRRLEASDFSKAQPWRIWPEQAQDFKRVSWVKPLEVLPISRDGPEALGTFRPGSFDLVVIDQTMPGLSGTVKPVFVYGISCGAGTQLAGLAAGGGQTQAQLEAQAAQQMANLGIGRGLAAQQYYTGLGQNLATLAQGVGGAVDQQRQWNWMADQPWWQNMMGNVGGNLAGAALQGVFG